MGSVTSALGRPRRALVRVGTEPPPAGLPRAPPPLSAVLKPRGEEEEAAEEQKEEETGGSVEPPAPTRSPGALANETGDKNARPLSRFARSKSQNCLWNTIIGGLTGNLKERPKPTIVSDPRPPEEILADELPPVDSPEALVKTSFRSGRYGFTLIILERISF